MMTPLGRGEFSAEQMSLQEFPNALSLMISTERLNAVTRLGLSLALCQQNMGKKGGKLRKGGGSTDRGKKKGNKQTG